MQLHCFIIELTECAGEIRAPQGNGLDNFLVMKKASVRSKPNSQVGDWSPPIYLVHSFPAEGSLPEGTLKHHLFKRRTCKGAVLEQSAADLKLKFDGLKKTVDLVKSTSSGTWDEIDTKWWADFFAARADMPLTQNEGLAQPPDPVMLSRIKNLLWGTGHIAVPGARARADAPVRPVDPARDAAHRALAVLVEPETHAAGQEIFGRTRAVGYLNVLPGETTVTAEARAAAKCTALKQKTLEDYFLDVRISRGQNEDLFVDKFEVCTFFCLNLSCSELQS